MQDLTPCQKWNKTYDYVSAREWPSSSQKPCWTCAHQFNTVPCFIPLNRTIAPSTIRGIGNFCSWNCAKLYLLKHQQDLPKSANVLSLLCFMTSHKGLYQCTGEKHDYTCRCLMTPLSINVHDKKYKILNYNWITQFFYAKSWKIQVYTKSPRITTVKNVEKEQSKPRVVATTFKIKKGYFS